MQMRRSLVLHGTTLLIGALVASFCTVAFAQSEQAPKPESVTPPVAAPGGTKGGYKPDIRKRVRAGELHACVTAAVSKAHAQPRLMFQNHCDVQVNVSLCVRVVGQDKAYFLILMGRKSEAQQSLWIEAGARYSYKYNSCEKPYCTPPEPDC